jgi:hypothetical protein
MKYHDYGVLWVVFLIEPSDACPKSEIHLLV